MRARNIRIQQRDYIRNFKDDNKLSEQLVPDRNLLSRVNFKSMDKEKTKADEEQDRLLETYMRDMIMLTERKNANAD